MLQLSWIFRPVKTASFHHSPSNLTLSVQRMRRRKQFLFSSHCTDICPQNLNAKAQINSLKLQVYWSSVHKLFRKITVKKSYYLLPHKAFTGTATERANRIPKRLKSVVIQLVNVPRSTSSYFYFNFQFLYSSNRVYEAEKSNKRQK